MNTDFAIRSHQGLAGLLLVAAFVSLPSAMAYELDLTPRSQFHIAADPAEFDYGYFPDGHFAYAKKLDATTSGATQYTLSRFVIRPQSGDLSRIEGIPVGVEVIVEDVGGGAGCTVVWQVTPFTKLLESCGVDDHQLLMLNTNTTYQTETNASARGFPGEHLTELRLSLPAEADALPRVSAGGSHTCGIRSDGRVTCWGYNAQGQAAPPAGTFKSVNAGGSHTCALRVDGTAACWGWNGLGQSTPPAGSFVVLKGGFHHNCGLRSDRSLACWGSNSDGQASPPAGSFIAVDAGMYHTCGVLSGGAVTCWGSNSDGQAAAPAGNFVAVTTGLKHGCAVRSDGTVVCWGYNFYGQVNAPAGTFIAVDAGAYHVCGLRTDRTVACWGNNHAGQANPPAGTFIAVDAGGNHTCGIRGDGTVACWGNNFEAQAPRLALFPATLADGTRNVAYGQELVLVDAAAHPSSGFSYVPPASGFALTSGVLPPGLELMAAGLLSGTPTTAGSFSFAVEGEDGNGFVAQRSYIVAIQTPVDSTPPMIDADVTGPLGSNGWYTGDVGISWSVTDDESAITATTGCGAASVVSDISGAGFTCTATSSGGTGSDSVTVKRDSTAPDTNIDAAPGDPGNSGDVQFGFDGSDAMAGIAGFECSLDGAVFVACSSPQGYAGLADGAHTFAVRATDAAGNVDATPAGHAWTIATDDSAPVIVASVAGTLGDNGWYTGDVGIAWSVTDDGSTITATTGCGAVSVDSDSAGASFTCSATSSGGTASETVTVKRDATPPILAPVVTPGVIMLNGSGSVATNASDSLSGMASESCEALATDTVGNHTSLCIATDLAGNSASDTADYSVSYGFGGFTPPIDNPPAVNAANAGRTIPFKWRVVDAEGAPVDNLAGVSLRAVNVSCDGSAVTDEVEQYAPTGTAFIDHGGGYYQYNWQSPSNYQNTCKRIVIDMGDGVAREALFRFK